MKLLKSCALILCIALLLSGISVAAVAIHGSVRNTESAVSDDFLSASSQWTMGSGWMDCSTPDEIIFQNTSDTAGHNFNKTLINGAEGFRIGFDVTFNDPSVQTTAGVTLRVQSNNLSYFLMRVTGLGDNCMLQVDYCDNGSWKTVVPVTAWIPGAGGKVHVDLEREEKHDVVTFRLSNMDGDVLYETSVSSSAWAGRRFADCSDLELNVAPFKGYGLFTFSGYHVESFSDDGIEPPLSAASHWNLGSNWEDVSTAEALAIQNKIQNAGPCFYNEQITAGEAFNIGFLYTGISSYTTADMTLRLTNNNQNYIRLLATQNNGSALVEVNFYDGANWTQLVNTGWLSGIGPSYNVYLEHAAGTDTSRLVLTKADSSLIGSWNIINPVCNDKNFYSASNIEALITTAGDYGIFSITDFTLDAPSIEASNWSMGINWSGEYLENGDYAISNVIENAGPNFYGTLIDTDKPFSLDFLYTGRSAYTTADVTLRLVTNHNNYIRMLVTQNNGTALVDVNYWNGKTWTALATTGWIANVGATYGVSLRHEVGSDAMTLVLTKADGSQLGSWNVYNAACTNSNFFSVSDLETLVTTAGNYGLFTITGYEIGTVVSAAEEWNLGAGWEDASGFGSSSITNTTDTGAGSAVWSQIIDGSDGAVISFDFAAAVPEMQTTAELILRLESDHNQYLRMVITARGTQEAIVETSYYNGGWISLDSTGWLSNAAINGAYRVKLSHQKDSADTTLTLIARDGTVFYEKTFSNAAFTENTFWSASYLQALFNPISGYGCFMISDFSVESYPVESVETDLWKLGAQWTAYPEGNGVYLKKTGTGETETVYNQPINGQKGFKISFDLDFTSQDTSACRIKLRIPSTQEIYLFARVKGDHNQTLLEAQSYDSTASEQWSDSLLSSEAGYWTANNGTVTVHLERQALHNTIRYYVVDKLTGNILLDETIESDVLTADRFLDYNNLEWSFSTDSGSPGFSIYHFTVEEYPADPVAAESLSVVGASEVYSGVLGVYTAEIQPANATIRSYSWSVNGNSIGASSSINYLFTTAGTYTVTLTVEDQDGNTLTDTLTVTVMNPPKEYAMGDLTEDEIVDAQDAQLLADYIVGEVTLTEAQLLRADMNGDGVIDSTDVYLILVAGKEGV